MLTFSGSGLPLTRGRDGYAEIAPLNSWALNISRSKAFCPRILYTFDGSEPHNPACQEVADEDLCVPIHWTVSARPCRSPIGLVPSNSRLSRAALA